MLKNLNYGVNLIIRKKTVLNEFDPDIGKRVLEYAVKKGIKVFNETSLKEIKKSGTKINIVTNKKTIKTNLLIYAIGRSPNVDSLNLENTKIKLDKKEQLKLIITQDQTTSLFMLLAM